MGPRLFRRGNETLPEAFGDGEKSFNGATPFQAWKHAVQWFGFGKQAGFNGATPFQAWKLREPAFFFHEADKASMGPRLFRRGNLSGCTSSKLNHALQWGHAFSGVETPIAGIPRHPIFDGFNGATPFQAWKPRPIRARLPIRWGFNGATPFQAWKRHERKHGRMR